MRSILVVASIAALCYAGTPVGPRQVSGTHGTAKSASPLEMSRVDTFAARGWTSEDIRVLDFHLGMSRADAVENARAQGLNLNCLSYCDVCDSQNILCDGIGLHFGKDDHVDVISVMRPLAEAPEDLRKFSVTQHFKGQTYALFHSYSNELRLKLFGPEADKVEDRKIRATNYVYPQFGLEVHVNLSANRRITESKADLTINFVYPHKPSGQTKKSSS